MSNIPLNPYENVVNSIITIMDEDEEVIYGKCNEIKKILSTQKNEKELLKFLNNEKIKHLYDIIFGYYQSDLSDDNGEEYNFGELEDVDDENREKWIDEILRLFSEIKYYFKFINNCFVPYNNEDKCIVSKDSIFNNVKLIFYDLNYQELLNINIYILVKQVEEWHRKDKKKEYHQCDIEDIKILFNIKNKDIAHIPSIFNYFRSHYGPIFEYQIGSKKGNCTIFECMEKHILNMIFEAAEKRFTDLKIKRVVE